MMVLFNSDVVTIFNLHYDSLTEEETWIPTLLEGVNLSMTKGENISKSGLASADSAKLYVGFDDQSGRSYVPANEYESLTLTDKKQHFTFTSEKDFFVKGDKTDVEVTTSGFFEWMLKHYDNVFKVTTIDAYEDVMAHMEIGGR